MEYRFVIVKLDNVFSQDEVNRQVAAYASDGFEVAGYSATERVFIVAMEKKAPLSEDEIAKEAKRITDRIKRALSGPGMDLESITGIPGDLPDMRHAH